MVSSYVRTWHDQQEVSLTNKTEQKVLAAIKKLAIREENTMVARVTLHNMRQDPDEPVRRFCARLRGQAVVSAADS